MRGGYVAITDNADPMHVVVYRTTPARHAPAPAGVPGGGVRAGRERHRELPDHGRALAGGGEQLRLPRPVRAAGGTITQPGFARVDVRADGRGCRWCGRTTEARRHRRPQALDAQTGLVYTYTQDPTRRDAGLVLDGAGLPHRADGLEQLAGTGAAYNNNYAGLALGPDATAYLGVLGGMVALRDGA